MTESWLSHNIKCTLSIIVVSLTFVYFFTCLIANIKPDPQIVICITNADMLVLGYWFGSSSSSSKKDDALISSAGNPTITGDSPKVTVNNPPAP